jgi:nucleotide-binding universal stress UspA family protein
MRILLAFDGSAGAEQAVDLLSGVHWSDDMTLRIVSVAERLAPMFATPWVPGLMTTAPELDAAVVAQRDAAVAEVVRRIADPGRNVAGAVLHGRPATVIVDEARRYEADLVIVGSRGHGAIASLLLGSVSAEIVDHAPCPVLVARRPTLQRILFATDGSVSAQLAEDCLAHWPILAGPIIRVVSVADVVRPWTTGIAPTMYRAALDAHAKDLKEATAEHRAIAEDAAQRLRGLGRTVDAEVRSGDAAGEIMASAEMWPADLVIMGSRGRTGLPRLILGSVARNVLHGSGASVLIVHAPVQA